MTCRTRPSGFSHLKVESSIDVRGCKLKRGGSARHSVAIENTSLVEMMVEIQCACPDDAGLEHAPKSPWAPGPRQLSEFGGAVTSTTFDGTLCAPPDGQGVGHQQLLLTVRRRPLRATTWAPSKTVPLKDIEVS
jgi:hypothetical protein